jgi:aspartate/methionine/tyrosine aminotransferase
MSGLSKIAGLPQLKLGWIVTGGSGHAAAIDGLEWIADTYLSVATPVQWALPRILAASAPVQDQIRQRTRTNLALLMERTSEVGSSCRCLRPEGGWYAIVEVPRIRTEEEWALGLLSDSDVLVQPAFFYDFEAEAFLVLSLLTPPQIFAEGLRRILDFVGRLS